METLQGNWTFIDIEGTGDYVSKIEDKVNELKVDVNNIQSFLAGHYFRIFAIDNSKNPGVMTTHWKLRNIEGKGSGWINELDKKLGSGKVHIIGSNSVGTVFYLENQ
ncbi:hypothetical protein [Aquimarina megaterium]|uniref:hypothetical protein n=1 Tax=Aquimarina megaterium TaxID=1443666 RepID=UPI00094597D3|nr:hypothetical protein [Aquimarina megaterium]